MIKLAAKDTVSNLLEFFSNLGKSIGSQIVSEAEEGFKPGVCIYPGAFKPPHKGHFEAVKDLVSRPYITQVKIIISPKERQGITADQSLKIWNTYLKAQPMATVSVEKAKEDSPIKDAIKYIGTHPKDTTIYIAGSADEVDDQNYFTELKSMFGDRVVTVPVEEKSDGISASKVRDIIRADDYESFKETIPVGAANRGEASKIFNDLTNTIQPRSVKEGIESSSVSSDIVAALTKFVNWCQQALNIQQLPKIDYIDSPTFTRDNKSFGGYNPSDNSILLSIYNRNPVDIMRTLAHELVHCKQNETRRLTSKDGETGSDIENEANAVAGMIMRVYGKKNPEVFEEVAPQKLAELTSIEPDDFDDEINYAENLDARLKDVGINWKEESSFELLDPNQIEPSQWNKLSDDPNNATSVKYSKVDPKKFPPILAVKRDGGKYEAIDGIHRVYAFRLNNLDIPAIVITPELEKGLNTVDTAMSDYMYDKYKDNEEYKKYKGEQAKTK